MPKEQNPGPAQRFGRTWVHLVTQVHVQRVFKVLAVSFLFLGYPTLRDVWATNLYMVQTMPRALAFPRSLGELPCSIPHTSSPRHSQHLASLPAAIGAALSGDCGQAELLLRAANQREPSDRLIALWLGDVLLAGGHPEEAVSIWKQSRLGRSLLGRARSVLSKGERARARLWADQSLQTLSDAATALHLADLFHRLGLPAKAVEALETGLRFAESTQPIYWVMTGMREEYEGNAEEALSSFERGRELFPGALILHRRQIRLCKELGRDEAAFQVVQDAIRQNPSVADWYLEAAHLAERSGNFRESLEWLDRAAATRNLALWLFKLTRGQLLCRNGQRDAALTHLREAVNANRTLRTLNALAECQARFGEDRAALATLQGIPSKTQRDLSTTRVLRIAAGAAARRGNQEQERELYEQLLSLNPDDSAAAGRLRQLSRQGTSR